MRRNLEMFGYVQNTIHRDNKRYQKGEIITSIQTNAKII
jgi:hypothetical protein